MFFSSTLINDSLSVFPGTPELTRHAAGDAGGAVQQAVEQVAAAAGRRGRGQGLPPVEEEPRRALAARRRRAALAAARLLALWPRAHLLRRATVLRKRPLLPVVRRSTPRQK